MSPARLQVSNAPAGIRVRMPVTSRDDVPHRVIYYNIKIDLSTIIFHYVNPALFILTNRLSFVSALAGFFPQIRAAGTCFEPVYSGCPVPLYKNTGLPHHTADRYPFSDLWNRAEQIIRRTESNFIRPRQCLHTRGKAWSGRHTDLS